MKNLKSLFFSVFVVLTVFFSCVNTQEYPIEPQIKFGQVKLTDSIDNPDLQNPAKKLELTFSVIDGDGDIGKGVGVYSVQSKSKDSIDFYSILYYKKKGGYIKYKSVLPPFDTTQPFTYVIPYCTSIGQNKTLKAKVLIAMDIYFNFIPYDTLRFEFYIVDRAEHKSNIIITPDLPMKYNGIIIDSTKIK